MYVHVHVICTCTILRAPWLIRGHACALVQPWWSVTCTPRVLSHNFYNPQSRLGPPSLLSTEPQSHGASGNLFILACARFQGNQNAHLDREDEYQPRLVSRAFLPLFRTRLLSPKVDCHRIDRENDLAGQQREENERVDLRAGDEIRKQILVMLALIFIYLPFIVIASTKKI